MVARPGALLVGKCAGPVWHPPCLDDVGHQRHVQITEQFSPAVGVVGLSAGHVVHEGGRADQREIQRKTRVVESLSDARGHVGDGAAVRRHGRRNVQPVV